MHKRRYLFVFSLVFLSLLSITIFANDVNVNSETNISINDSFAEEIYLQYSNAEKIEFIINTSDLYYFRVFEQKGNMNYKVIEYDANSFKMKELIWIWSKSYDSEIRTIQLETEEVDNVNAKVYLRSGEVIDQKISFIDPLNNFEFVE